MIGNVIQDQFFVVTDYPMASALSFTLMLAIVVLVFFYVRKRRDRGAGLMAADTTTPTSTSRRRSHCGHQAPVRSDPWVREHIIAILGSLVLFYMFLPIFVVILFSFNDSHRSVQLPVGAVLDRGVDQPLRAPAACATSLRLSLQIGVLATLGATVLGTLVAFASAGTASAAAARRTCSSSCRWRRPRSSWARRC